MQRDDIEIRILFLERGFHKICEAILELAHTVDKLAVELKDPADFWKETDDEKDESAPF
jgi:hypothetical protein